MAQEPMDSQSLHSFAELREKWGLPKINQVEPVVSLGFVPASGASNPLTQEQLDSFRSVPLVQQLEEVIEHELLRDRPKKMQEAYKASVMLTALALSPEKRRELEIEFIVVGPTNEKGEIEVKHREVSDPAVFLVFRNSRGYNYIKSDRIDLATTFAPSRDTADFGVVDNLLRDAEDFQPEQAPEKLERIINELGSVNRLVAIEHKIVDRNSSNPLGTRQTRATTLRMNYLNELKDELLLEFLQQAIALYPSFPGFLKRIASADNQYQQHPLFQLTQSNRGQEDFLHMQLDMRSPTPVSEKNTTLKRLLRKGDMRFSGNFFTYHTALNVGALQRGRDAYNNGDDRECFRIDAQLCSILGL